MEGGDRGEHKALQWSYCLLPHARGSGGGRRKEEQAMTVEKDGDVVERQMQEKGRYSTLHKCLN